LNKRKRSEKFARLLVSARIDQAALQQDTKLVYAKEAKMRFA